MERIILSFLGAVFLGTPELWARASGEIHLQVRRCTPIVPQQYFSNQENLPEWLVRVDRSRVLAAIDKHAGILLTGRVIFSQAKDLDLNENAALQGKEIDVFITGRGRNCDQARDESVVRGLVKEHACREKLHVPCLVAGIELRRPQFNFKRARKNIFKGKTSKKGQKALDLLKKGKVNQAIQTFAAANRQETLKPSLRYAWAVALHSQERCGEAGTLLKELNHQIDVVTGSQLPNWQKDAKLLYARCLAMLQRTDDAVQVLNEMLLQPRLFRKQIGISVDHLDFGYINSDPGWKAYVRKARRLLSR